MIPRFWTRLVVLTGGLLWAVSTLAAEGTSKLTLNWVGCGISKKAYVAEIAKRYEEVTGIKIEIAGGGATKGIRQVASGEADIGGSCRFKLRSSDEETDATLVPVAWDALAVIVHPDNPVSDLTLDQVRDIYLGKVTNWSQVGGPNAPLKVFVRKGKISGVGRTVRKLVFANYDQDFVATQEFDSTGPLEQAIEQDVHAMGITGISSARKRKVKLVALNGKEPSYENIKNGDYLLYRPLYLAYNRNGARADEVKDFIQVVHGREGQDVLRRNGTVPYLEGIHLVRRQIKQTRDAKERGL